VELLEDESAVLMLVGAEDAMFIDCWKSFAFCKKIIFQVFLVLIKEKEMKKREKKCCKSIINFQFQKRAGAHTQEINTLRQA
jgi:hypothetical protein